MDGEEKRVNDATRHARTMHEKRNDISRKLYSYTRCTEVMDASQIISVRLAIIDLFSTFR